VITGVLGLLVWCGVIPASLDPTDLKMNKVQKVVKDRDGGKGLKHIWRKGRTHLYKIGGEGPQTLFFGDSNTEMYAARIGELLKDNTGMFRGALILACGGVPPFLGISNEERPYCVDLMPKYDDVILNYPQIDRVVISALWTFYFTPESKYFFNGKSLSKKEARTAVLQEFGKMIGGLTANGKKVTVVLSIPVGRELEPRRLYRRHFFSPSEDKGLVLTKEKFLNEYGTLLSQIASVAKAHGASVIDPVDYLCKDGICIVEDENGPIHYDFGHLRSSFVRDKVKYLDATMAP
jgi:hypothetical protein